MENRDAHLTKFQERLGYTFRDQSLLQDALTHPTYGNEHGKVQRNDDGQFAFLGDAVLSLAVAADLMKKAGGKGTFSIERAKKVRREHLTPIAKSLEIPLLLGQGETDNAAGEGTRLAEGLEAVFGAITLDAGPERAIEVINDLLGRFEPELTG